MPRCKVCGDPDGPHSKDQCIRTLLVQRTELRRELKEVNEALTDAKHGRLNNMKAIAAHAEQIEINRLLLSQLHIMKKEGRELRSAERINLIVNLRRKGLTHEAIAARLGVDRSRVSHLFRIHNIDELVEQAKKGPVAQ